MNQIVFGLMYRLIGQESYQQRGTFKFPTTPRKGEIIGVDWVEEETKFFKVDNVLHAATKEESNIDKSEGDLFITELETNGSFFGNAHKIIEEM